MSFQWLHVTTQPLPAPWSHVTGTCLVSLFSSYLSIFPSPLTQPLQPACYYFCLSLTGQCPGTAVSVIGTTTGATDSDPSWECFVDNVSTGSKPPYGFPENNWVFCEADSLPDTQHTITLRAIDAGDPAVTYGPGWQDMRDSTMTDVGKMTLQQGRNATVDFSGEYLAFMGLKSDLQSS